MGQREYELGKAIADEIVADLAKQFGKERVEQFFILGHHLIAIAMMDAIRGRVSRNNEQGTNEADSSSST